MIVPPSFWVVSLVPKCSVGSGPRSRLTKATRHSPSSQPEVYSPRGQPGETWRSLDRAEQLQSRLEGLAARPAMKQKDTLKLVAASCCSMTCVRLVAVRCG